MTRISLIAAPHLYRAASFPIKASDLPDVKPPSTERIANTVDEYSQLTARYGEPDTIVYSEASPFAPIPVGTAHYGFAHVDVVFVPSGCVDQYNRFRTFVADKLSAPTIRRELRTLQVCVPAPQSSWTMVDYLDTLDELALTGADTTHRLNSMAFKRSVIPLVEFANKSVRARLLGLPAKKTSAQKVPEMKSNDQARIEMQERNEKLRAENDRATYGTIGVPSFALVIFISGLFVHRKNSQRRETCLIYELDQVARQKHSVVQESLHQLSKCQRLWRIEASASTWDWKRNAGASSLIRRSDIAVRCIAPPRVKTNVQVNCIDLGQSQLYFLPDTILYRDGRGFGGISYSDFGVTQSLTRFIESGSVPADATVVSHTWQYVNKDGGPDRRFNHNRQLPILLLGVLRLTSSTGLNIELNTSNAQQSAAFADHWRTRLQPIRDQEKASAGSQSSPPNAESQESATSLARKMLGVTESASGTEISAAYRNLAQMYHPDKVAGLGPEFRVIAEKRMKEINAAYELLKKA